jgi:hypothetical protein
MSEIYFVHAIDTEGPLFETIDATFDRIKNLYGLSFPKNKRTLKTLRLLKNKKYPISERMKEDVSKILNNHLHKYNNNLNAIKLMNQRIFSKEFRKLDVDSFGKPWVFSWHCLDHVGYKINPRKRILGYHKIFDFYKDEIKKYRNRTDKIFWHFHPMSTYCEAHKCATSYVNSPEFYQILSRKIIERNFFPSSFRAGFQSERPDSNLILEQWIPFDISNMSHPDLKTLENNIDFKNGRSGDWRRATKKWEVYNPDHNDYQISGNCNRYIGRALNVLNRIASVDESEIKKAFIQASNGKKALVGFASHDFRDLEYEVNYLRNLIKKVSKKFPKIKYNYTNTKDGFRSYLFGKNVIKKQAIKLGFKFYPSNKIDVPRIKIYQKKGEVFGPQPYLAIQTKTKRFIHDNFDFDLKKGIWHYAFHNDTIPLDDVLFIGIASNDKYGNTDVIRFKYANKSFKKI